MRLKILLLLYALVVATSNAQQEKLNTEFKKASIKELEKLLDQNYVFPDAAKTINENLEAKLRSGHFNKYENIDSFAVALTKEVKSYNQDGHLMVWSTPQTTINGDTVDHDLDNLVQNYFATREGTRGFIQAKKLSKNVSYLSLWCFDRWAGPVTDSYMNLLSTSDALILDLKDNNGGDPHAVQYLLSYFFDKPTQLNSIYWRFMGKTEEYWSLDKVSGKKMPDIPVFIITSKKTNSAAEAFCYDMQAQKRAILIGETTNGAANPGGQFTINSKLAVFIPTGQITNPITKTNWEGKGVIPDIKASADSSYKKALQLATIAATDYRKQRVMLAEEIVGDLRHGFAEINKPDPNSNAEELIYHAFKKCVESGLLREGSINNMGYQYMERKQVKKAEATFRANTLIYPNSANAFDSYAESLLNNGKKELAVTNYKTAFDLATQQKDPYLKDIIEHLKNAQK